MSRLTRTMRFCAIIVLVMRSACMLDLDNHVRLVHNPRRDLVCYCPHMCTRREYNRC
jgi:hypothetical protein